MTKKLLKKLDMQLIKETMNVLNESDSIYGAYLSCSICGKPRNYFMINGFITCKKGCEVTPAIKENAMELLKMLRGMMK